MGEGWSSGDAFAGAAAGGPVGAPAAILVRDSGGCIERGGGRDCRRLGACRGPVVPRGWRDVADGEGTWSRRIALALRTRLGMGGASFRSASHEMEVDTAFTGVWRRDKLLELGGWDERWHINEDAELAARIREAGGRYVCLPAMAARYVPRASLRALARQYWRYGQYRAKTGRYHPTGLRRSHLLPPAVVLAFAGSVLTRGRPARLARTALLGYGGALAAGTVEARGADSPDARELACLPLVFAIMHFSWGAGFLLGCLRFGPPVAALARMVGGPRRGADPIP